ncbi:hypothetical protein GobsT_69360 [Gemmata obscuriglobus]|uniref:Uncharacterized protein n=1 Tax=Gemmata obscuriglobus TaxID=114 RepID=A0A2Z3HDW1_9BACT|nr:hypothetical protein [Gemmata obscuriglobus]AWM41936.1 hypothetical protein C1280_36385 [Gemmata obscuriglobus]QEG32085.1 hypothetical protein GobsT_69360 [Gemmata obscuriglobus]VTS11438.1 unnamed protein product [Gemmata obscuriglobus UQM 2246]
MKKRLLCLGLVAAVSQLLVTGCYPIARFRANHPCLSCGPGVHPLLHPIQTRRAILGEPGGVVVGGPVVGGPVVGPIAPPCHGCAGGAPGIPVGLSGGPIDVTGYPPIVVSSQGSPSIGSPQPLTPGTTVTPGNQLPAPMPLPKQ